LALYDTNVRELKFSMLHDFPDDGQAQAGKFGNNIENI
jgi:hypothetical protein